MKSWIEALREFNQGKTEWCIPKKDTAEYQKVKSIMKGEPPAGKKAKRESIDVANIVLTKRLRKTKM